VIVLIVKVLSPFLIIFLYLIALFILDVLSPADYLLRAIDRILKDHLLRLDVLDGVNLLTFAIAANTPLLTFFQESLEFLGQLELIRILFILLLEVFEEHLFVLVVQLVQIDHHLLLITIFIVFIAVIAMNTMLLLLVR
jgi:hypothetical protein